MQYTTDYVVSIIQQQTEREFERDLERRRIARERADEWRAATRATAIAPATDVSHADRRSRDGHAGRMPWAGQVARLRSLLAGSRDGAEQEPAQR
ncbi:hypothetical protein [Glaciibacter sp. 2TAF33]|uniref:hypothetical protein n=1 Tax=Glaciibacter sp. 2TAF33 TaxID=3233015 RepID=UPI003F939708